MTAPKVTVVTPTHLRHSLLTSRCIPSVAAQEYDGEIEHIIVSGPDPELRELSSGWAGHIRFREMGENVADGGATPRRIGCELATGDLIAYLDDDVAYRPNHLTALVAAIEREDADFAFSVMQTWNGASPAHCVGTPPPMYGAIDTSLIMNRPALLARATWEKIWDRRDGRPPDPDGDIVGRWMQSGASWAFTGQITVDYWHGEPGGSRA